MIMQNYEEAGEIKKEHYTVPFAPHILFYSSVIFPFVQFTVPYLTNLFRPTL